MTISDGTGGRGEHGRGRQERGRGRGRGRQDGAVIKDDVSIASSQPDSISSTPHEGGRRQSGRQSREGRNKPRGPRVQPQAAPPQSAPEISAEGSQTLPPGIPRAAEIVLPPIEATRPVVAPGGSGWSPKGGLGPEVLPPVSQLSLGKPNESGLSPTLDPVAPPLAGSDSRQEI